MACKFGLDCKIDKVAEADKLVKLSARLHVDDLNMLFFSKSLYSFKILDDNSSRTVARKWQG